MIQKVIDKLSSYRYNGDNIEELELLLNIKNKEGLNLAGVDILKSALQNRFADDSRLESTITLINKRMKEYMTLSEVKDSDTILKKILIQSNNKNLVGMTNNLELDSTRVFSYYDDKVGKVQNFQTINYLVNEAPNSILRYFMKIMENTKLQQNKIYANIITVLVEQIKAVKRNDIVIMPKAISRVADKNGEIILASKHKELEIFVGETNKLKAENFLCSILNDEYKVYKKQYQLNKKNFNVIFVLKKKNLKESFDKTKKQNKSYKETLKEMF